jgi:hypothetical protein
MSRRWRSEPPVRALQVSADRSGSRRQRSRYFTLATPARFVQSQRLSDLAHGEAFRHPPAVAPLRGALGKKFLDFTPQI